MAYMRLGDLLVSSGIITGEQLEQALALPREDGQRLGDVLIRQGVISEAQLIDALRVQLGVDFVDLTAVSIPVELAKYVPRNLAKKFLVVPVKLVQDRLYLAMHDPLDFVAQDEVKTASRKRIIPMIATRKAVEQAIERLYGSEGTARVIEEMKREAGAGEDIIPAQMARDTADPEASAPTIRFVNSLIERAFTERASDIHLEPQEGEMLVRMRIDGLLQRVLTVPADLQNTVISRLKIMGGMNIAEHKVPQDGHAMFSVRGHSLDLRIASMPTVYGEKIVLRLLDKSAQVLDKSVLGLEGRDLDNYNALLKNTSGVVLLVGPTGSGKSTTMSNMLRDLSSDALNIVTLEDPVEYHLPGVNQCQINEKTGMTFASGLRAILRQDPDIIAVGEIRDGETASIAMRAAITGHLVFSTLHTNDAARMDMLRGNLSYLSKYTWNTGSSPYNINGLRALSYEQMSGRADIDGKRFTALLNGGSDDGSFHWVTTEENGQSAHGKYSFPGSAAALRGQDYPFPTVLTQGTACLHYGEWPSRGLYWSSGVLSLDRITTPSVTLSLHFTQDTDADAVPVITCSREGIVDVSVPQAQTPPADVRHSYVVTLTGLSVGSTEVFATLGGYTARLLVSVTSTLDISVDGLPGDDFFVGDTCNLTLTARDSRGSALDVNWTVTPQHGNSVLTASVPVTNADRTASVTLTAAGEGEDRTLITAAYTAPGGETFTSQLPLVLPVRMQGVLGIANTSVPETPAYKQGIMTHAGDAFLADTSAPLYNGAPYTAAPAYTGAPVYLYGQGSAADLTAANEDGSYRFTLSAAAVTVGAGTDAVTYDALSGTADYRIIEGQPQSLTDTLFTVRPLTVKGKQAGNVTLTVTLMDTEGHAFTLSIPYTLTEEDTRVTATLRVDEQALTLSVPYGTAPAAEALSQLLTDNGISPDTIDSWTPDITQPLYADTAFTAVRKTTDSGGAPTVPDADIPASGSKDPEGTPSDDPSAPDSSSSGTDPTPEPSPDTLP